MPQEFGKILGCVLNLDEQFPVVCMNMIGDGSSVRRFIEFGVLKPYRKTANRRRGMPLRRRSHQAGVQTPAEK